MWACLAAASIAPGERLAVTAAAISRGVVNIPSVTEPFDLPPAAALHEGHRVLHSEASIEAMMTLPEATLAGMRKTNNLFCSKAIRTRDMEALEHVYTSDAHLLPPGADMIHGMAAIKNFWLKAVTGLDVKDASLTTVSAEATGDSVVEIGRAELTLAAGQIVPIKYVVHWKFEANSWRWHTDIWNLNQ